MKFPKQRMTEKEILTSKPVKAIEKHLKAISFNSADDNQHRVYKNPSNGKQAMIYDLQAEGGISLLLWVSTDGSIVRAGLGHDTVIATASKGETVADTNEKEIARELLKKLHSDQKSEFKVKIDKRKMSKLIEEIDNDGGSDEEVSRLEQLKTDLTKGSGKFVVFNNEGEFLGKDGFTKTQSKIITFTDVEEAQKHNETVAKV
ncbi:MAG: hypothetical protein GQ474_10570 [Sulfurimonas sp.]|nr:hypothetical protein [Sulfurimonas sp.]